VDWDEVDQQIKEEEKEESPEGEDALNAMFKKIYADADEDTRRAMNKSFQVRRTQH
jgi:suppressor of G2 allele of SKP1